MGSLHCFHTSFSINCLCTFTRTVTFPFLFYFCGEGLYRTAPDETFREKFYSNMVAHMEPIFGNMTASYQISILCKTQKCRNIRLGSFHLPQLVNYRQYEQQ